MAGEKPHHCLDSPVAPSPRPGPRGGFELVSQINHYLGADDRKALGQVLGSVLPFLLTWFLMYRSLAYSYWLTLGLAVPAAGFLLRIFLLQHDLGHGALFRSKRLNDLLGSVFGVLTVIPYHHWRRIHIDHHSHSGDLERRGPGCVKILTVDEYLALSPARRWFYRLRSNPFLVLLLGAPFLFLLVHRVPYGAGRGWKKERRSVHLTNLALVLSFFGLSALLGASSLLAVHLPVLCLYSSFAVWLFLTQHCFSNTYWAATRGWDFFDASLMGSSYYKLPRILQWFTLNAGYHHVHHLSPKVPNYRLQRCHDEIPALQAAPRLTLRTSLQAPWMVLWDEERGKLIGFRDLEGGGGGPDRG